MSKNRKYAWATTVVLLIMSSAKIVSAQMPEICQQTLNDRAYNEGYRQGEKIVEDAWTAIVEDPYENDCYQVANETYFKGRILYILEQISMPGGASDFTICYYHGYITGVATRLQGIQQICEDQCVEDGTFIGQIATMMYCELSIALGGLALADDLIDGILTLCQDLMVDACEGTFETMTQEYESPFGVCEPYTQGDFEAVWNQAKTNQCVANPDTDTETGGPDAGL